MVDSRLDFLNFATEVGKRAKDQAAQAELDMARNREALANARERTDDDSAFASGFGVVRFIALGEVATRFGAAFNDPLSQTARDAARAAAGNFLAAFTDKKAENGFVSGMSILIGLGSLGERARNTLDMRLKHYQDALKNAKALEDASERKAAMADAQCYTSPARKCPKPDGSCVSDDGKPFTPTHNYVPERVIPVAMGGGKVVPVTLKARGATTRESQLYAYCALVAEYGEAALSVEVADAMLFNGGRWVADTETLSVMANKASDAVNALLATHGGGGDTAFLQLASSILGRIAAEGFKTERAAEIVEPEPVVVVVPDLQPEPESSPNVEPDPFQSLLDSVPETAMGAALAAAAPGKGGKGRRKAGGGL